jgi:23S rRNA (guanine745-N1)-methyltransferase
VREELNTDERRLFCENGHSFDLAKSGYFNLLLSQQSKEKRHGDDKLMVRCSGIFE